MKWLAVILGLSLCWLMVVVWRAARIAPRLVEGETAPDFQLRDPNGRIHTLVAYRGRWLVLYFYPRDATPGCTREACDFRDNFLKVQALDADIVGISVDRSETHARFARQHRLPFPLLADPAGKTAAAYGALFRLGPLRFARRHTFILTPEGCVGKIFRQVHPGQHAAEVGAALAAMQRQRTSPEHVPACGLRHQKPGESVVG